MTNQNRFFFLDIKFLAGAAAVATALVLVTTKDCRWPQGETAVPFETASEQHLGQLVPQDVVKDQPPSDVVATPGRQTAPAWFMPPPNGTWGNDSVTLGEDCYVGDEPDDPCTVYIEGHKVDSMLGCVSIDMTGELFALRAGSAPCEAMTGDRQQQHDAQTLGRSQWKVSDNLGRLVVQDE